jgi:glutamate carboxypeptidase
VTQALPEALEALRRRSGEMLALTEKLVRINSFTKNVPGVDAVGEALCEALSDLPLEVARVDGAPWGAHYCFSTQAAASAPCTLLIGHHDTVFPPGSFEGFRADGTHAYGPGVLDMKGGLSLVVCVLHCLHDAGALEGLPLRFVSVSDEEVGSPNSRTLLRELAGGARAALVFEAGRAHDAIVTARRGTGFARVGAHGRAAHAGNALNEGRNAIWALARFIDRAQALNAAIPGASLNTGLVQGGSSRNTVPAFAEAELDLRFDDGASQERLFAELERCAQEVSGQLQGTRIELELTVTREPWERSEASVALCQRYLACQREAGLSAGEAPRQGGGSDGNTVAACGLPVIDGLGPRGRGFHTPHEQVEIASFPLKAEALLRFLLCAGA